MAQNDAAASLDVLNPVRIYRGWPDKESLPEEVWLLSPPGLEGVDRRSALERELRELAAAEPDVARCRSCTEPRRAAGGRRDDPGSGT